ncbi:MAG: hypothetical protein AMS15_06375 [Planctomycetes bacterium DG_23]|nr:MAG: hypothetical protein AMS15_06375 [Planctomycetes bacterium DG_23]
MKIISVTPHIFKDHSPLDRQVRGVFAYSRTHEDFRRNRYAFTCLVYHPGERKIYCGTTNFANDLVCTFDPETGEFESKNYASFGEEYEIKIHRGIWLGRDGKIYAATSCLHDTNERLDAPGGKVFSYDPKTDEYALLCIPSAHDYIQTITLDAEREMIYGMTYPVFNFFAYSIREDRVVYEQFMRSITHIGAVDDAGGYWGTWGVRHHLFRYDPEQNRVRFFKHGLPVPCENLMYPGAGPIDCMINGGDGFLYVGTEKAELYRIDPNTGEVIYLGKPHPANRLPAICLGEDGLIYGTAGDDYNCIIFTYDRNSGAFKNLGVVRETEAAVVKRAANPKGKDVTSGRSLYRPHDFIKLASKLYVGETDNRDRNNYLWECELSE